MDKYLTPELKEHYMKDFNNHVLTNTDKFYGLDDGLPEMLIEINMNPNIQTLFSRYSNPNTIGFGVECLCYLWFAYTKDVEGKVKEFLTSMVGKYNKEDYHSGCSFHLHLPRGKEPTENGIHQLGWVTDPNYFDINNFRLELETRNPEIQKNFWQDVMLNLPSMK